MANAEKSLKKNNDAVKKVSKIKGEQKATVHTIDDIPVALHKLIYDKKHKRLDRMFMKIEEIVPQITREQMVYGLAGFIGIYLVIGSLAQLVCNFIGFAYPAYASVKAIRTIEKDDDTHWLTYWTVFAFYTLFDSFADNIMNTIPLYWLLKVIFLTYLFAPQTYGAEIIYEKFIDPAISRFDKFLAGHTIQDESTDSQVKTAKPS